MSKKNATASDGEWFELMDHQNNRIFYANPSTGECTWTRPTSGTIKPKDPNGEWWELYDDIHDRLYYYNSATKQTDWIQPETGTIVPLTGIQLCLMKLSLVAQEEHDGDDDADADSSTKSPCWTDSALPTSHTTLSWSKKSKSPTLSPSTSSAPSSPRSKASSNSQAIDVSSSLSESESLPVLKKNRGTPSSPPRTSMSPSQSSTLRANRLSSPGHIEALTLSPAVESRQRSPAPPVPNSITSPSISPNMAKSPRPITFLPENLKNDITRFMIDGFAAKYFATHKKGIFIRKKVPLEVMICWTKDNLDNPLMVLNKSVHKEALKCFKQIQRAMGDRSGSSQKGSKLSGSEDIRYLLEVGINHGELRDEIYVQLCKQLSNNPSIESVRKGWEIMCVICITFPPSKNFEDYLKGFIGRHERDQDEKVAKMAKYAARKLEKTIRVGPRGKTPSIIEIDRAREAPFSPSLFGETLDDIMEVELIKDPSVKVPRILTFLTEAILALQGQRSEGIFRVPGDAECVTELKIRMERGIFDLNDITDPNVPASLLKLWLRELTDPLIPAYIYDSCIKSFDSPEQALSILDRLPEHHAAVTKYTIEFLQIIAHPDNEPFTKMSTNNLAMVFAPNFLRCPSDDPTVIFANTIFEQGFLRTLLLNYRKA